MSDSVRGKRKSGHDDSQSPLKVAKIHPFFLKHSKPSGDFTWHPPLGPSRSCLYGTNLSPKPATKVAALDLDGTVIKSEFNSKIVDGKPTWSWWRSGVPSKLAELHENGYAVIFFSNQANKPASLKTWKDKMILIGQSLNQVPFRILTATAKDQYRKPMTGMWTELEEIFKDEGGVPINKLDSFFVGDAAGRQYANAKSDFSSTDRKWALNIGLKFLTPEEFFLNLPPATNYILPGFHPSTLPTLLPVMPTSSPIIPDRNLGKQQPEVVLLVGYPCIGKTSFFRRHFAPAEYVHINQDTLKTREKCVKAVREAIEAGRSCLVDNTNRNAATRKLYLDICNLHHVASRCFVFTGSMELAWHNNLYRAYNLPPSVASRETARTLIPYSAFTTFRDNYEEPQLSEGFSEIKKVNWVFEGPDEEKKHWLMWLQIDGK